MMSLHCYASPAKHGARWMQLSLAFLCLEACISGDASEEATVEPSTSASALIAASGRPGPIEWVACPSDFTSECAWVALPVDHDRPDGDALPVFVSRTPAASGHATAQLWLLQGGPGGSGNTFTTLIANGLSQTLPDMDFYVLEHRGVGESARLGCDAQESSISENGPVVTANEWPACAESLKAQWGLDKLARFSTTQDAHDLASLIARTREPDKRVFIYGVSYGTTRAMRFLQTHPDVVDGVVLDSVVSPSVQYLSQFDDQFDPVAKELAQLCTEDSVCAAKLGPDPWGKVIELLAKLEQGHCPAFLHRSLVQSGFTQLLLQRELRAHIFPLTYRLDRCDPQDLAVIERYFSVVSQAFGDEGGAVRTSQALQNNVALSELWEEPAPSLAELRERCASQVLCPQASVSIGVTSPYWPRYPRDEYVGQWPEVKTPILAMNGTLDPQTPIGKANAAQENLRGPHQHFVTMPWSPHGVAFASPVATAGAPPCGMQLVRGFLADPHAEPDTACINDLLPPFALNPNVTARFFGSLDMWENTERASAVATTTTASTHASVAIDPRAFQVRPLALGPVVTP